MYQIYGLSKKEGFVKEHSGKGSHISFHIIISGKGSPAVCFSYMFHLYCTIILFLVLIISS